MNEEDKILKLLEQIKNGDERAFAEFYSQTYKYVYSRAKCMFSDEEEVQDLVQEVYLALYRNAANIQSSESIFGWLKTTTFYQGTKMLKKKRKEVLLSEDGEEMFESIPDDEPEIEEGYMNQEDVQVIRECINRLSDEQKTVLLAYYYDNLKVNEIAEILSLSAGTIKSRLYLARKNLQVHIEEEEKKRGYKLHSFGAVTLALALRMFLQGNMEVAGSVEETIFAKVCQGLNFEVSKAVVAHSGLAEQVVQEGTKQAGKGILGKLEALGAKKVAISTVGIIAAVAIGGVVIGGLSKEDSKKEAIDASQQVSKSAELQQWQIDYARVLFELICVPEEVQRVSMADSLFQGDLTEYLNEYLKCLHDDTMSEIEMFFGLEDLDSDDAPELIVEFVNDNESSNSQYMFTQGKCIEECYVGKTDCDDSIETYSVTIDNVLEMLSVDISKEDRSLLRWADIAEETCLIYGNIDTARGMRVAEIWFDDDDLIDRVFLTDEYIVLQLGNGVYYDANRSNTMEYWAYVEKQGNLIEYTYSEDVDARDEVTRLSVFGYERDDTGFWWPEETVLTKNHVTNSDGTVDVWYKETSKDAGSWKDITEEEYLHKYDECNVGGINMLTDLQYQDVLERLYKIEISLAK